MPQIIKRTCLKAKYTLRKQLYLSFGTISSVSIVMVMLIGVASTFYCGYYIKTEARKVMVEQLSQKSLSKSSIYISDAIIKKFETLRHVAALLAEVTRDRFVGYPYLEALNQDSFVPFYDPYSLNQYIYPLKPSQGYLPLEWNITSTVNASNYLEHFQTQTRYDWFLQSQVEKITTSSASYFMQGACDPQEKNASKSTYYKGCTFENNNIITGGKLQPTNVNRYIYAKASDLSFIMKALYEYHTTIVQIGIFFANDGAGAAAIYPATERSSNWSYVSIGCDWMNMTNPFDVRNLQSSTTTTTTTTQQQRLYTIGTQKQRNRCHKNGTIVPGREFNPLERAWCRDEVLRPNESNAYGPYRFKNKNIITFGRAVFDRLTGIFIGCVGIDVGVDALSQTLFDSLTIGRTTRVVLIRWDAKGTIVGGSSYYNNLGVPYLADIDPATYQELRNLVNYSEVWDPQNVSAIYAQQTELNNSYFMAYPIPPVPSVYDPKYKPNYMSIVSIETIEALKDLEIMDEKVHATVRSVFKQTLISGICGLVAVLLLIWFVCHSLTRPLTWMSQVSKQIVENAGCASNSLKSNLKVALQEYEEDKVLLLSKFNILETELSTLVLDFGLMLDTFSGEGAAKVAKADVKEVKNEFRWKEQYRSLYVSDFFKEDEEEEDTEEVFEDEDVLGYNVGLNDEEEGGGGGGPLSISNGGSRLSMSSAGGRLSNSGGRLSNSGRRLSVSNGGSRPGLDDANNKNATESTRKNKKKFLKSMKGFLSKRNSLNMTGSDLENGGRKRKSKKRGRKSSRRRSSAAASIPSVSNHDSDSSSDESHHFAFPRVNTERNIVVEKKVEEKSSDEVAREVVYEAYKKKSILFSPLFLWILALIASPTLLTMALICSLTTTDILSTLPIWLDEVQLAGVEIGKQSVIVTAATRSSLVQEMILQTVGDLYVYTRVSSWLLFGALSRSNGFTGVASGVDECKIYSTNYSTCPIYSIAELTPCDCKWKDPRGSECTDWSLNTTKEVVDMLINENVQGVRQQEFLKRLDSRYLQRRFAVGQAQDADPVTGSRTKSSYPQTDTTPPDTKWYRSPNTMPGSNKGSFVSGYTTTYDRVRVLSAMSVIEFPLYNFERSSDINKHISTNIAFEADGTYMGYSGCGYGYLRYSGWQSTKENLASDIRPDICPIGKYGYDPRCRDWYDKGKIADGVYITPPYIFAGAKIDDPIIGSTATLSIEDLKTGRHVAQTSIDFSANDILSALDRKNTRIGEGIDGFVMMITPEPNIYGSNTLIGPGFSIGNTTASMIDLVLPYDKKNSTHRNDFERDILDKMKNGTKGFANLTRNKYSTAEDEWFYESLFTSDDNTTDDEEAIFVAFEPIFATTVKPLSHSDFSRGTTTSQTLVYSLAIAIPVLELVTPFAAIQLEVSHVITIVSVLLIVLITISSLIVIAVTYKLSSAMLRPIFALSRIVRSINNRTVTDDIPKLKGGSLEVANVYDSFEKLYKVVQSSNATFFSGDLDQSYKVLTEAQDLFKRLNNQKAMGVVSNNIGVLKARQLQFFGGEIGIADYMIGKSNFDESILVGTHEKNTVEDAQMYGDFVKQLANRYFNRAVFLVIMKDQVSATDRAIQDILAAKELDEEAWVFWNARGSIEANIEEIFDSILTRTCGMLLLVRDHSFEDVYGIDELIKNAERLLMDRWDNPASKLFQSINRVGRYQQITDLMIQYEFYKDNIEESAKIAMKMLVEDSYIIDNVFANAVAVVNMHFKASTKNVVLCLDYSASMAGGKIKRAREDLLDIYDRYCADEDFVGFIRFNNKIDTELSFPLEQKSEYKTYHEIQLSQAVHAKGGSNMYHALDRCVDMVEQLSMNNSWIVVLTDGDPWDEPDKVIQRIQKWNAVRSNRIHVITIGYDISRKLIKECKALGNISQYSKYIDASDGIDSLGKSFGQVAYLISSDGTTMETY